MSLKLHLNRYGSSTVFMLISSTASQLSLGAVVYKYFVCTYTAEYEQQIRRIAQVGGTVASEY